MMNRADFFRKLIRYTLLLLMALIAIALIRKVVPGENCSACPGNGICKGESDCSKYLTGNYGGKQKQV